MTVATLDLMAELAGYLRTTGTDLYTLVGTRVYVGMLANSGLLAFDNSSAGILLRKVSGSSDPYLPIQSADVNIFCYGGTTNNRKLMLSARAVELALHDALHGISNVSTTNGRILEAMKTVDNGELVDPDTEWPFILVTYSIDVV